MIPNFQQFKYERIELKKQFKKNTKIKIPPNPGKAVKPLESDHVNRIT
jgi:hypothetical protein